MNFNNVGLIVKPKMAAVEKPAREIIAFLKAKDCTIYFDPSTEDIINLDTDSFTEREIIGKECDLVIVIGGDGTFLDAACSLASAEVPLIGINIGRLGFLVDVSPVNLDTSLEQIFSGDYTKEKRFLLTANVLRNNKSIHTADAFNDVVIHLRDVARMMEFDTSINGTHVNYQRADGLIIATPTGSTAYALSSGGPLLHPTINAITLVPISPHTLSSRPIVVNADSEIDILIYDTKDAVARVTCDGKKIFDLQKDDIVRVKRQSHLITLLHPPGYNHYHTLREKLHWSEHPS